MDLASYKAGNNFKTFVLVAALTGLLLAIGYLIGGASGLIVFAAIAVVFNFVMYWFSGKIALKMSRAVPVSEQEDPELHRMIAGLAARAGVPKPAVYMTPAEQPNAFATGRNPKHAAIAVTARDPAGARPARARGRPRPRDGATSRTATSSSRASPRWWPARSRPSRTSSSSPCSSAVTTTTRWGSSAPSPRSSWRRSRPRSSSWPSRASASTWPTPPAPSYLGDPNPLADALETLQRGAEAIPMRVNRRPPRCTSSTRCGQRPRGRGGGGVRKLFSTHPPMEERVARLRRMAGASSLQLQTF